MQILEGVSTPYALLEADPAIEIHHDAVYLPCPTGVRWDSEPSWGVFSGDGTLIDAAAYYRGPGKQLVGQFDRIPVDAALPYAEVDTMVYAGPIIDHFGHFLLSTLGRFWAHEEFGDLPLLGHGAGAPAGWLSHDFAREMLGLLGVNEHSFAAQSGPVRVRRLIIPRPSFEEHNFIHRAYKRVSGRVGDRLLADTPVRRRRVGYLSKSRLQIGVQRFTNEIELETRLAAEDVDIIHPETLSLSRQAALFRDYRVLIGSAGSAFHTSVLSPPNAHLIQLTPHDTINSNLRMTDHINGNRTTYAKVDADMSQDPRFLIAFRFRDPDALAAAIMDRVDEVLAEETDRPVALWNSGAPAAPANMATAASRESDTTPKRRGLAGLLRLGVRSPSRLGGGN